MNNDLSSELTDLAAELALGVLEGDDRANALRNQLANPAFAAMVRTWQDRFEPLGDAFAETPPPHLWPAIAARLDDQPKTDHPNKIRFWRNSATLAGALAAGLAAVMIFNPTANRNPTGNQDAGQPAAQAAIAQLTGEGGSLFAANGVPASGQISIRAVTLPASALVPELWIIPADGVPRSLGVFKAAGVTQIALPAGVQPLLVDGATLAVSLERAQGAPHAAPSSTPIATGIISTL